MVSTLSPVSLVRIYQDQLGEWRWSAKAGNGRTIADSGEGYKNKGDAEDMATRLFPGAGIRVEEE